jgi:hypothetical protein
MAGNQQRMVELEDIRAAVAALEVECAAGRMSDAETARRVNQCRRAVTPRDLWKASGKRAGARRRSDWADIRRAVTGIAAVLIMCALGVWLVTWTLAQLHGSTP